MAPDSDPVEAENQPVEGPSDDGEPAPTEPAGPTFASLGIRAEVLATLTALGYEEPTPIQAEAIPPVMAGRDLLGQAATGTGKTAAFALPILERIVPGTAPEPVALVLVPTRELAVQVSEAIYRYGRSLGTEVLPVYGGQPIGRQLQALRRGTHVVVATPGRAIDHINRGTLPLDSVELVVLDEADEMLDMGFAEDIEAILAATPETRQTVLFSATLPPRIDAIARKHLTDPVRIRIERERTKAGEAPRVAQRVYMVARAHKPAALGRILDVEAPEAAIVFCRTRNEVDQLTETLNGRGYRAEALHGGMDQEQRDRVMGRLRARHADLVVATDVAARGLDIEHLTHVVHYDVPSSPDTYVHRTGRVGRAGREGVAITLAEPRERRQLGTIERVIGTRLEMEKVPSVAELKAAQLDQTLATLRQAVEADDGDRVRPVVDALADEFELVDIALAAVRLIHEASGTSDDTMEIPDLTSKGPRPDAQGRDSRGVRGRDRDRGDAGRGDRPRQDRGDRDRGSRERRPSGDAATVYVGLGHQAGVRPGDLVGAITGETQLHGTDIGAIRIFERFSLVEIPADSVQQVIESMRNTTIRGRPAGVRKDRGSDFKDSSRPSRPPRDRDSRPSPSRNRD